jgi:hypothetical protein
MTESFGIPQVVNYLKQLGLKISQIDRPRNTVELAFHGEQGKWKLLVGIHQSGDASKLMLIVPHFAVLTNNNRIECLEALMAINYRIALGKFGMDPTDGEIRLEESIPLANNSISFEQFRLALSAIMQTVSIYNTLFSRLTNENIAVLDALQKCEQEFFKDSDTSTSTSQPSDFISTEQQAVTPEAEEVRRELDVNEVLAEVTWLLGKSHD